MATIRPQPKAKTTREKQPARPVEELISEIKQLRDTYDDTFLAHTKATKAYNAHLREMTGEAWLALADKYLNTKDKIAYEVKLHAVMLVWWDQFSMREYEERWNHFDDFVAKWDGLQSKKTIPDFEPFMPGEVDYIWVRSRKTARRLDEKERYKRAVFAYRKTINEGLQAMGYPIWMARQRAASITGSRGAEKYTREDMSDDD